MIRRITARLGLIALLATVLLALADAPASAHGPKAHTLVREAIALMVNSPGDHDAILKKINAALRAEDTSNVQMPLVRQAREAFEAGDPHQAQRLLEQSIGARVHTTTADPVPANTPPPAAGASPPAAGASPSGTEHGTDDVPVAAQMPGRGDLNGGDWVFLALSLAVSLCGIVLAVRMRPHFARHLPDETETTR